MVDRHACTTSSAHLKVGGILVMWSGYNLFTSCRDESQQDLSHDELQLTGTACAYVSIEGVQPRARTQAGSSSMTASLSIAPPLMSAWQWR